MNKKAKTILKTQFNSIHNFNIYEILPGFIVCLIFTVVFSLLQKNKDPEMLAEFDAYKKMSDADC